MTGSYVRCPDSTCPGRYPLRAYVRDRDDPKFCPVCGNAIDHVPPAFPFLQCINMTDVERIWRNANPYLTADDWTHIICCRCGMRRYRDWHERVQARRRALRGPPSRCHGRCGHVFNRAYCALVHEYPRGLVGWDGRPCEWLAARCGSMEHPEE